ncbi:MAG: multicopper oxidase domain-containing protein [Burkholderiales bacterium]|nr:multicopper oxidase domain-containing protein [Burkholderiales bacterium]
MKIDRRELLVRTASSVAAVAGAAWGLPATARSAGPAIEPDVHIELHAEPGHVTIRRGVPTRVWRYRGRLLRGDASVLETMPGSYLGPLIRVRRGQRVRIELLNGLPEPTIIHWHGLHVPDDMDGHPRFAIAPGARYVYEFTVRNRAGSYWFHPHPHGRTGAQVAAGLAGLFIVGDDEEAALGLPAGVQDIPLVIQDRQFDSDNQFVYPGRDSAGPGMPGGEMMGGGMMGGGMMGGGMMGGGMMGGGMMGRGSGRGMMGRGGMGSMMAAMMGVLGDHILVNGGAQVVREVARRPHRLRLLNGANTRTLKLAWSDGSPLTVIGSDGGLLARPVQRDYVMLAPAERVDLWADFGRRQAGSEVALRSLAFEGGMDMSGMMGGGMMGGQVGLADGAAFEVQRFRMDSGSARPGELPAALAQIAPADSGAAINAARPKVFEPTMGMMVWGINGQSFDMLGASEQETVKLGTQEVWEFRNEGRGSMMGMLMPHAMHVHGLQFRVLSRAVSRRFADVYRTVGAGFVDEGWKDTVLVMPGERVRVLLRFEDYPGLFLYHCHMLEHEDSGLMRNYLVKA